MNAGEWTLTAEERTFAMTKNRRQRLAFGLQLLFYRMRGKFPDDPTEIDAAVVREVARLLNVPPARHTVGTAMRTEAWHRTQIREFHGFREASVAAAETLTVWLTEQVVAVGAAPDCLTPLLEERCRELRIEPPSADRIDRIVRAAISAYEERFCTNIVDRLSTDTRARLNALLETEDASQESAPAQLLRLRGDPGRPSIANLEEQLAKLQLARNVELPPDLFSQTLPHELERYRRRAGAEAPYEMRRHPEGIRLTLLAAYVHLRSCELTDDLVDLLIETIHQIGARAEKRVDKAMLQDLKRVRGKPNILFEIATVSLEHPDGAVRDVVFPVAGEQTLRELVAEGKATGGYKTTLRTVIRNSYKGHYRRMVPQILQTLEFRSNNQCHRPVMQALELIKRYSDTNVREFPIEEDVPMDGIASGLWREAVVETDVRGELRINRITYEICVLEALREKIRCKEIWVVGASRYRNPDEDLPADFERQRIPYYEALKLPLDSDRYIADLQTEMRQALHTLDTGMLRNHLVRFSGRKTGWITVTPFKPQAPAPNLAAIKAEIASTWPMTSLLDMAKEADLRLGFTRALKSATAYETLSRDTVQRRLLLCIHGIGTNTGLQRMANLQSGVTYKDLAYIKSRYITPEGLREAIVALTNGTLRIRDPGIWGKGTTACASDSKHFGAWDQNLTSQWHMRYGGRGIMIYWHVDDHSLCIYSQLKSPASSEVASMIEGVMRHCTEMEVDRQYVDSHGQSTIAFAFCRLLNFELLPRLKAIHKQKLYRPDTGQPAAYPNLQLVLTKPIEWNLIRQQYDEMVKHVTALRLGTANAEAILRRFTKNNVKHPTYRAFAELGKAVKTIFLCRYLHSEALRREIHEGLNVIENWNSANDFLFFARRGELASNRKEDQEISMLCLHLLQNCMVYVNTLMLQKILAQPHWKGKLTARDLSAITPLIWDHVNPYGRFELDMNARLPLL